MRASFYPSRFLTILLFVTILITPQLASAQAATAAKIGATLLLCLTSQSIPAFAPASVSIADGGQANRKCKLASTVQGIKKEIILGLLESVNTWVDGGFNGSPTVLANPVGFLDTAFETVASNQIATSGLGFLCSPFDLRSEIRLPIPGKVNIGFEDRRNRGCNLDDIKKNVDSFKKNHFPKGVDAEDSIASFIDIAVDPSKDIDISVSRRKNEILEEARRESAKIKEFSSDNGTFPIYEPDCLKRWIMKMKKEPLAEERQKLSDCDIIATGNKQDESVKSTEDLVLDDLAQSKEIAELLSATFDNLLNGLLEKGISKLADTAGFQVQLREARATLDETNEETERIEKDMAIANTIQQTEERVEIGVRVAREQIAGFESSINSNEDLTAEDKETELGFITDAKNTLDAAEGKAEKLFSGQRDFIKLYVTPVLKSKAKKKTETDTELNIAPALRDLVVKNITNSEIQFFSRNEVPVCEPIGQESPITRGLLEALVTLSNADFKIDGATTTTPELLEELKRVRGGGSVFKVGSCTAEKLNEEVSRTWQYYE